MTSKIKFVLSIKISKNAVQSLLYLLTLHFVPNNVKPCHVIYFNLKKSLKRLVININPKEKTHMW